MHGIGWQCDHCAKIVITREDMFLMNGRPQPPSGWYTLIGPSPGQTGPHAADEAHLCSTRCTEKYSGIVANFVDNTL